MKLGNETPVRQRARKSDRADVLTNELIQEAKFTKENNGGTQFLQDVKMTIPRCRVTHV